MFIEHFLLYFFWNPIIFVNLVLGYDLGCFLVKTAYQIKYCEKYVVQTSLYLWISNPVS